MQRRPSHLRRGTVGRGEGWSAPSRQLLLTEPSSSASRSTPPPCRRPAPPQRPAPSSHRERGQLPTSCAPPSCQLGRHPKMWRPPAQDRRMFASDTADRCAAASGRRWWVPRGLLALKQWCPVSSPPSPVLSPEASPLAAGRGREGVQLHQSFTNGTRAAVLAIRSHADMHRHSGEAPA